MNKHIKSVSALTIIGDLPKLPFVKIHHVSDIPHDNVSSLPQAQINLVDNSTASGARVLLRFTDVALDEHTDAGVAATILAAWIKKLLAGLNEEAKGDRYSLAMPSQDRRPYMPAPGWQPGGAWQPGMGQRFGMQGFGGAWPDARRFGEPLFGGFNIGYNPNAEPGEYQAQMVAHSLLRDIGTTSRSAAPSLGIVYTEGVEGPFLRFEGALGHGVTFGANRVPSEDEMAFVAFLDDTKKGGYMAGYFHVGGVKYLYTTGHQHGYHDETRSLLTQAAVSKVFNDLWEKHHKAMGLNALPVHFDEL